MTSTLSTRLTWSHFVELLNGRTAIYDKLNGAQTAATGTDIFFGLPQSLGTMVDPRILYDHQSNRWVACAINRQTGNVVLAVSNDSSPTLGNWTRFTLQTSAPPYVTDFTTLGLDSGGIYVAVVYLQNGAPVFNKVVAIKKPQIYQGTLVSGSYSTGLITGAVQPALNFDTPVGGYIWFVAKGAPSVQPGAYQAGKIYYRRMYWGGATLRSGRTPPGGRWLIRNPRS